MIIVDFHQNDMCVSYLMGADLILLKVISWNVFLLNLNKCKQ